jgi:hypothetical protein
MTTLLQPYSKSTPASLALWPVVQTLAWHLRAGHNLPECRVHRASVVFGENHLASLKPRPADRPRPTRREARLNSVQFL